MIHYLSHNKIDKNKWDECVKNAVNGLIYGYSWYLDIVCPGWDALVEDDYKSIMPLPVGKKYRFPYIYPAPFTQQLGVFSTNKLTDETVSAFLKAIPEKFRYVEMNMNTFNRVNPGAYKTAKLVTYLLDLIAAYEHLYSNYSKQTQRNLKKAQSSALTISANISPAEIIALFRQNRGRQYKHKASYYTLLNTLMLACIKNNSGQCRGVYTKEKELCAAAFFTGSNKRVIFLFSGVNAKGYKVQAMTYLVNHFIETNSQRDVTFDFEGSMDPDIARFYKGFGSRQANYIQIRRNTLPSAAKWIKELQFKRRSALK